MTTDLRVVLRELRAIDVSSALRRLTAAERCWLALSASFVALFVVRAIPLGPFGDDDGYHLSAPKRWLELGSLRYLPSYTVTNGALSFEMLYAIGLATMGPQGVKLLHLLAALMSFAGIGLACRRFGALGGAMVAISFLLIRSPLLDLPLNVSAAGVDFGPAWMMMGSVLMWQLWREHGDDGWVRGIALGAGLAGTFKSTALTIAIGWALLLLVELRLRPIAGARLVRLALQYGLITLLAVSPWMLRAWLETGNPIYPMLPSVFPTRDWSAETAHVFSRFLHYYSWGIAAGPKLDENGRRGIVAVAVVLAAVGGALLVRLHEDRRLKLLTALSVFLVIVTLLVAGMIIRYSIPAFFCLSVPTAAWLHRRIQRGARSWLAIAGIACALVMQLTGGRAAALRVDAQLALGVVPPDQAYAHDSMWQVTRAINEQTAPDAKIMFASLYPSFGAANFGAFWVDRVCFTTDSHTQEYLRFSDWDAFLGSVVRAGVTHVVLPAVPPMPGGRMLPFSHSNNEYSFARRLVVESGEEVYAAPDVILFGLDAPRIQTSSRHALRASKGSGR